MKKIVLISLIFISGAGFSQEHKTLSSYSSSASKVSATGSVTLTSGFHVPAGSSFHAFISSVNCTPLAPVLSQNQNYIVTYTPREPFSDAVDLSTRSVCEVMQSVEYFDGLGRPLQKVQTKGSPDATKDIVVPIAYDAFGREARKYLPYASASNNGSYKADALNAGAGVFSYYHPSGSGDQLPSGVPRIPTPFAETVFEPSPLNRVQEQGAPGEAWKIGSGHTVRTEYTTNNSTAFNPSATTGSKRVALYRAEVENDGVRKLTRANNTAIYANNQLYVTIIKDENWTAVDGCVGTSEEYKDKEGRVVLKRTYNKKGSATEMLSTYYVYDDFGNLCFVLPPLAEPDADAAISTATLNNLCYQYRYDHRNRVSGKKLPGKHWEFIVYNKLDQVVLSQDGNQRSKSPQEWTFSKYDGLGRVVMTGIYQDAGSTGDGDIQPSDSKRAALQTSVNNQPGPLWEERLSPAPATATGYTNRNIPTTISSYLTIHYYDDYEFPGGNPYTSIGHSSMTRNLLTGSRTKILKPALSAGTADMLWLVNYYDDKGRVSRSFQQHYKGGTLAAGNVDEVSNTYSFTHELETTTRIHKVDGTQKLKTFIRHTYDHMGRLVKAEQQINSDPQVVLVQNVYNEIGQLKEKKLHNGTQATRYTYNPRGWLKSSSSDQFSQELKYEDGRVPQYNGNISDQYWGAGSNLNKDYAYRYDRLNRLVSGVAKDGMSEKEIYYDKGGNILGLQRYISNAAEDKLKYSYSGNQLSAVYDSVGSTNVLYQLTGTTSYSYDRNGNMISRINTANPANNISSMSYNVLNLPQSVSLAGNKTLSYVYDAAGNKLRKTAGSTVTEYIGGIQYTGDNIDFVLTPAGRAIANGGNYKYEYNLADHLGNTRYSFDIQSSGVSKLQEDDYYPFGLRISRQVGTQANKYLYNGKELQDELNQYDYGSRFYDPVIGRFTTIDPQAEAEEQDSWTAYHYGFNNPIKHIDPDGEFPILSNIVGGLVAAGVEYGSQVAANVYENGFTSKAFTENIDGGDILIAAGEGFLTSGGSVVKNAVLKGGIKVAAEVARNAVDVKNGKVTTNSVKSTAANTAVGLVAGKVSDKAPGTKMKVANAPTPKEAVKAARANGPVNRSQRIATETAAKAKQKTAKEINSAVNKGAGGVVVGGASEEAKRKIDKKIN